MQIFKATNFCRPEVTGLAKRIAEGQHGGRKQQSTAREWFHKVVKKTKAYQEYIETHRTTTGKRTSSSIVRKLILGATVINDFFAEGH